MVQLTLTSSCIVSDSSVRLIVFKGNQQRKIRTMDLFTKAVIAVFVSGAFNLVLGAFNAFSPLLFFITFASVCVMLWQYFEQKAMWKKELEELR